MNPAPHRYAVGRWESLWASEPYMSHRFVIDLPTRKVIAGQNRIRKQWHPMSIRHVDYMQQILEETFSAIFEDPHEYGFETVGDPPSWAVQAWPWPRINEDDASNGGDEESTL
ncbi:hypothetical protein E2553_45545 [Paraburkholderia dipogonis]|uniref:Uncharacterized protein n=1 Tax=Paraburkholderia dipogonis TaxID=1211383 RepID=A0A4Y8MHI2_9BURK|nr:hypothetical protein [Paraburkholderia dipogonis]TFE36899.1 hypothetical protein E2553_45545 [Paraburkholderia dipogonis]